MKKSRDMPPFKKNDDMIKTNYTTVNIVSVFLKGL